MLGLDLDNTVIDYGPAYPIVARHLGIDSGLMDRASIRKALLTDSGDEEWQRFQSCLYTWGLKSARPAEGLDKLLDFCQSNQVPVSIISHKTARTPERFGAHDLRFPALEWLGSWGLTPGRVPPENVHFCPTRELKVQTVRALQCHVFVDDLAEVVDEPTMPRATTRLHFGSREEACLDHAHVQNLSEVVSWLTDN